MFGFDHIERLAHELEFLYSDIRDGLRQVDEAVIDIALHAVDIFADLLNGMDSGNEVDKLIATIHHLTKNKAAQSSFYNLYKLTGVKWFFDMRGNVSIDCRLNFVFVDLSGQ